MDKLTCYRSGSRRRCRCRGCLDSKLGLLIESFGKSELIVVVVVEIAVVVPVVTVVVVVATVLVIAVADIMLVGVVVLENNQQG